MTSVDFEVAGYNWATRSDLKFSLATSSDIDDLTHFILESFYQE